MTTGSPFKYWGSVSGLNIEVKFYSAHSTQLLNPWFPATMSCLGVCILPGQSDIRGFCYHEERFQMCHQKKVCSYLQSSHLQDLTICIDYQEQFKTPFPWQVLSLSPQQQHTGSARLTKGSSWCHTIACRGWCCTPVLSELRGTHLTCRGLASMIQKQTCTGGSVENN